MIASQRSRRLRSSVILLSAIGGLIAPKMAAASLNWDPAKTGTASDGSGNWDLSDAFWSNGSTDVLWPNDTTVATFGIGGTAGIVTLTSAINAGGLTFNATNSGDYTIASGGAADTLTLGTTTPTITVNSGSPTISAPLLGSAGLILAGAGTLNLSGANTYTGATVVTSGTLTLAAGGTLGASTNALDLGSSVAAGSVIDTTTVNVNLNDNATVGSFNNNNFNTAANVLTIASGKTLTVSGAFSVGQASSSTAITTVLNTYAGATDTSPGSGGTLTVNGSFAVGVANTGTASTNKSTANADFSALNTLNVIPGTTASTFYIGSGQNIKSNTVLAANNTINVGTIAVGSSDHGLTIGNENANAGTVLTLGSGNNIIEANSIFIGTGKSTGSVIFRTGATSATVTIAGTNGGLSTTALTVGNEDVSTGNSGASQLLLAGVNATVQAGAVNVGVSTGTQTAGTSTGVITFDTGTFNATSLKIGTITITGTGAFAGGATGAFTMGTLGVTADTAAHLNVSGSLTLAGNTDPSTTNGGISSGTFTMNGGTATISGGIATVNNSSQSNVTNSTLTLAGGVLNVNGAQILNQTTNFGTVTVNMPDTGQTATIENLGGNGIYADAGTGSGSSGVNMSGAGTLVLAGNNTYNGPTNVNSGTLQIGSGTLGGSVPSAQSFNNNSAVVFAGSVPITIGASISGGGSVTQNSTSTTTLSASNSYSGNTNINSGVLAVTGSVSGNILVNSGGTLAGNGSVGSVTLSSGGAIHPGATAADLTVGTLNVNSLSVSGGDLRFDVGGATADSINDSGAATFTGGTISIALDSKPTASPYTLITSSSLTGMPTLATTSIGRTTFSLNKVGNSIQLITAGGPASLTWNAIGSPSDGVTWNDLQNLKNFSNAGVADTFFDADNVAFTDVNSGHDNVTVVGTVSPSSVMFSNTTAHNYVISGTGAIGGNASLIVSGTGSVTLQTANTYGGNTNVNSGTLVLSGGGSIISPNLNVGGGIVNINSGGSASSPAVNVNSGSLNLNSGGSLTAAGVNITVASGANLTVASGALLPSTANLIDNGITTVNGATTLGTLSGSGVVNLNGSILTIAGGGMLATTLQDGTTPGGLNVPAGSLTITGAETYTGPTTIVSGGNLTIGNGGTTGSLSASTAITNAGTLTYSFSNSPTITNTIVNNGTLIVNPAGSILTGAISGTGIAKLGAGPVTVSGDLSGYTGSLQLDGGTDTLGGSSPFAVPSAISVVAATTSTIQNVGKLTLSGTETLGTTAAALTFNVAQVSGNMPDGIPADVEITGSVNETSGLTLTKTGPGTLALSGATDDAAIGATVNAGTLLLNKQSTTSVHAVGGAGLMVIGTGTVMLGSPATGASGTHQIYDGSGTVTIGGGGTFAMNGQSENVSNFTLGDTNGGGVLNNNVPGTASVLFVGISTLAGLDTGGTTAPEGALKLATDATVNIATGSSLEIQGNGTAAVGGNHTLTNAGPGTLSLTGSADNAGVDVAVTSGMLLLGKTNSGAIHAASAVTGVSAGATLQLAGTGTDTNYGGNDQIYDGFITGTTDFGVLGMNGTFDLNGQSEAFDKLTGSGSVINSQTATPVVLTLGTNNGVGPTVSDFTGTITGAIALVKTTALDSNKAPVLESNTPTPAVILSGANNYTGATTITAGILQIGDGGSAGTLGTGPVTNNDTLTFDRSDNALVVTAPISGTGILNQIGTGTTTLSAVNTYTGNTNVTAGTLTLADTGAIGTTSNVTVAQSATANINGVFTGSPAVNVNGVMTVGPADASNHPAGTTLVRTWSALTLGVNGDSTAGSVSLGTGTDHTLLVINGNGSSSGLTFGGSTGAWAGKLDLGGNNGLVIKNGSLSDITNQLKQGFNAGAGYWNGSAGIVSSAAAANSRFLTTLGVAQGGGTLDGVSTASTDVLVKYTYYGDADLNGTVNGADYQQIDLGFGAHLTGWSNGDFNYDGVVNGSDFALIDNTFNQLLATGAAPLAIVADPANLATSSSNLIASPLTAVSTSAVPEPATLGLLGIGAIGLLGRRRRRAV